MTDELAPLLGALDVPRPLPDGLRKRLEHAMATEAMDSGAGAFSALDAPRPLPDDMRERLEWVLAMRAAIGPHAASARAERRARAQRRQVRSARRDAIVAAVAAVVLTATSMALSEQPDTRGGTLLAVEAVPGEGRSGFLSPSTAGESVDEGWAVGPPADGLAAGGSGEGGTTAGGGYYYLPHPPPPYHAAAGPRDLVVVPPSQALPPLVGEPLRIGIVPGDPVQAAGFRAYVDLLNKEGGAGGHQLHLVPAESPGTIATVNLSTTPVADGGGAPIGFRAPLIEGLVPFEHALGPGVLSPGGVPERQAVLAVRQSQLASGERAVVYHGGAEPFAGRLPAAFDAALRAQGVEVVHVEWKAAGPPPSIAAHAAFLSLPTDDVRTWLEAARAAGYRPAKGIWGLWSAADQSLAAAMPDGVQVVAPYGFPPAKELADLEARAGQPASVRLVHGWLTAKWLAVAVWRGGDDSDRLAEELRSSPIDSGGFLARYEVGVDGAVRTPEAVVLKPEGDRLRSEGSFGRAF